ncbi:phosphoadenosine phosphosulfate reductase family protein [Agrobacterium tumefaciens]|uniref:phosphoadenosine phosphosulfate reductase domain-containing protein n=1 Tax=Agrobacterium tumefaciens TaxID=358 RepID=UPI001572E617|nr:phosphoadenosine phosphosulfate reductase family protein [Agrobacterium tumefaciens]
MSNSPFILPKGNLHITLSGGRTSAYLLHCLLEQNGDLPDRARVVFANTGREDTRTLDFVQEIAQRWSVPITWVQFTATPPWFEIVNHNSAARDGEPFEAMIRHKRYTPNGRKRICTEQLKVRAARRMLVALGWKKWTKSLGIRADETHRHDQDDQPREKIWMPLISAGITKPMVLDFWRAQPFDLPQGVDSNCRLCFQFGLAQLANQMREQPDDDFPDRMEELGFGTFLNRQWSEIREFALRQSDMFSPDSYSRRRDVCGAASNEECSA